MIGAMPDRSAQRGSSRRRWVLGATNLAGVLGLYFAVPTATVRTDVLLPRLAVSLVGVGAVTVVLTRELGRGRRQEPGLSALRLVLLVEVALVAFSLAYYVLGTQAAGQMVGIRTRLDALYFTLSTTATVGYGDIHPTGQLARVVASGHILFNVLLLGAVARLVTARAAGGRVRRGGRPER